MGFSGCGVCWWTESKSDSNLQRIVFVPISLLEDDWFVCIFSYVSSCPSICVFKGLRCHQSGLQYYSSGLPGYSSKEVSLSFSHMARNIRNIRNSRNALFLPFRLLHYRSYAEHSANSGDCWFSSEGGAAPSDVPRFAGRNQYDIAGTKVRSEASS